CKRTPVAPVNHGPCGHLYPQGPLASFEHEGLRSAGAQVGLLNSHQAIHRSPATLISVTTTLGSSNSEPSSPAQNRVTPSPSTVMTLDPTLATESMSPTSPTSSGIVTSPPARMVAFISPAAAVVLPELLREGVTRTSPRASLKVSSVDWAPVKALPPSRLAFTTGVPVALVITSAI